MHSKTFVNGYNWRLTELDRNFIVLTIKRVIHATLMFAVELAEMLSADMQKEGLCGRTLTLKLKTASFEVLLMLRFCIHFPTTNKEHCSNLFLLHCW